ncbi:hypothetical protein BHM03_00049900 [Ensete ventricosum]|nr:hypothetical protein BHM03_00049900 [Ensete ventricosum]
MGMSGNGRLGRLGAPSDLFFLHKWHRCIIALRKEGRRTVMMLTGPVLGVVVVTGGGWRLRRRPDNHRPVCMEEGGEADDAVRNGEATVSGVGGEVGAGGHGREEGTRHCCFR